MESALDDADSPGRRVFSLLEVPLGLNACGPCRRDTWLGRDKASHTRPRDGARTGDLGEGVQREELRVVPLEEGDGARQDLILESLLAISLALPRAITVVIRPLGTTEPAVSGGKNLISRCQHTHTRHTRDTHTHTRHIRDTHTHTHTHTTQRTHARTHADRHRREASNLPKLIATANRAARHVVAPSWKRAAVLVRVVHVGEYVEFMMRCCVGVA
jgi:hypothetical protein